MMATIISWALMMTSLLALGLLAWLGIIVLVTAERRRWAVWMAGLTMLIGAGFFGGHAALMSQGDAQGSVLLLTQWPIAWVVGLLIPCAWYVAILWHVGLLERPRAVRHAQMHLVALGTLLVIFGAAAVTIAFDPLIRSNPLILFTSFSPAVIMAGPYLGRLPVTALIYALLMVSCLVLSLDALRHPAPSHRMMGDLARQRARPWLVVTSFLLLALGLLACGSLLWFMPELLHVPGRALPAAVARTMMWIDLLGMVLALAVILALGQAVVSYEVFTGLSLPRKGLQQHWARAVVIIAGVSVLLALALVWRTPPIYSALAILAAVAGFVGLHTWRSFVEQEQLLTRLRALLDGPQHFDALVMPQTDDQQTLAQFRHFCEQVLCVRSACLWPLGTFSSLLAPHAYPDDSALPDSIAGITTREISPQQRCVPTDPDLCAGASWAVPLWGRRGMTGLFLLGEKCDGGLYSQEEMTLIRAAGERMMDTLASMELARQLMRLQRLRLDESPGIDGRTRRLLHDEILPQLHTAMLELSAAPANAERIIPSLGAVHRQIADLLRELPAGPSLLEERGGVLGALRQLLADELCEAFCAVNWHIDPTAEARFGRLSPQTAQLLFGAAREAVRNAARHGRGDETARPLQLRLSAIAAPLLTLVIEDDGVGVGVHRAKRGGAGQGIMLHSTLLATIGGSWETESHPGGYTRVTLRIPEC